MVTVRVFEKSSDVYRRLCEKSGPLFEEWLSAWNALDITERDIYSHPVYVMSWLNARYHMEAENVQLFSLYDNGSLIGIVPLSAYPLPLTFRFLYYLKSPVVELGSTIGIPERYREEAGHTILETPLNGNGKPLAVGFLRIDETNVFLRSDIPKLLFQTGYSRNVFRIPENYRETLRKEHKHLARELRRKYNILSRIGDYKLEFVDTTADIAGAFERFVDLEIKGWKKDQRRAMRNNPFIYRFYRDTVLGFAASGNAVICNLVCNGETLSSLIGIVDRGTLYGLKIAYNETYQDVSPGFLLLDLVFDRYCPGRNITAYNQMSSCPWFNERFHPSVLNTYSLFMFPPGLSGVLVKMGYAFFAKLKKTLKVRNSEYGSREPGAWIPEQNRNRLSPSDKRGENGRTPVCPALVEGRKQCGAGVVN